jgi:DNA replication ATP-dependent helicase Dna2
MNYIDSSIGKLLFDRLEEIIHNERLQPKEKIPKYRTILEDLFKALIVDIKRQLSGLAQISSFVFEEYEVPNHIKAKTSSLRKFANDVVHDAEFIPSDLEDLKFVYHLSEVIGFFSKSKIPDQISKVYSPAIAEIKDLIQNEIEKKKFEKRDQYDVFAVIQHVYIPEGEKGKKFIVLTCESDDLGLIKISLWNNKDENGFGSDLTQFKEIAQKHQKIFITKIQKNQDKENEYFAIKSSYIVLEPDYLIDAKALSECRLSDFHSQLKYEDNPLLYHFTKFTKGEITSNVMVGNVVGNMLDNIITKKSYNYKDTFEKVMRDNAFAMLCIANEKGLYERENINPIYQGSHDHEVALVESLKQFKKGKCLVEPTFISNKYGIQGRLDLLVEYPDSNKKDIIELKSSKNPPSKSLGHWPNHEAQAMCYDLLLDSTYPNRTGTSSILYSAASLDEEPLRGVDEGKFLNKQDLLMTRNRIVANELELSEGNFDSFKKILDDSFGPYPSYHEKHISEFKAIINSIKGIPKSYFYGYLKFIFKELVIAKIGGNNTYDKSNGYSDLWKASKSDKLDNYDVLIYLKITEISEEYHLVLEFDRNVLTSNVVNVSSFRIGDTAIFYPTPDTNVLNPLNSQILKCRVISVFEDKVEVSLVNKQVSKEYFEQHEYWALDRDFREYGFNQNLNLLYEFIRSSSDVIDLVLGKRKPQFDEQPNIEKGGLDDIQYKCVVNALSAKNYYLIQGPPGTGKTSKVLAAIVKNLTLTENVLVVAYTNRAVDEICGKLVDMGISCIRIGKGIEDYHWSTLAGELHLNELNEKVKQTKVIVSTISSFAANLDLLKLKEFDTLVIDEASQILEPQLVGILKHFKRWILIGDEKQLPAVVLQNIEDSKCEDQDLIDISLTNYRESLFYRLIKNAQKKDWDQCYGSLEFQYRMHSEIANFPNVNFYGNNLKTDLDELNEELPDLSQFNENPVNKLLSKSRIVFVPSQIDKSIKINSEEADLVAKLLKHIKEVKGEKFEPKKTVGVITPFRAQIANIRNKLNGEFFDVTIDTVERFQGSERDIVIISFAIKSTNQLASIQSLNDEGVDRKLNVAITRAKDHLIMMGSEDLLNSSLLFKDLIEHVKSKGGYMSNPLLEDINTKNLF